MEELELTINISDSVNEVFICPECEHAWECLTDEQGPLQCSECKTMVECSIIGIGDLQESQLGKKFGKYSWCDVCETLTCNVSGTTYCGEPLVDAGYAGQEDRFFACEKCSKEKFWCWSYHCPKCDADKYAVVCINDEAHKNYDGSLDWEEMWKCLVCGLVYNISNGT